MKLVQRKLLSVWVVCSALFTSPAMAIDADTVLKVGDTYRDLYATVGLVLLGLLGVALLLVGFGFIWGIITGMEYQNGYRAFKNRGPR